MKTKKRLMVCIEVPLDLLEEFRTALARVGRQALPDRVWTDNDASRALRTATWNLANAAERSELL